ncbi:hypothetical protein HDU79_000226 [Rhizoclosmatium sp. JEL0117]|nr:hypothetical protein HDU79_000226 [Rhizoclosmatium sp. JEL0117]
MASLSAASPRFQAQQPSPSFERFTEQSTPSFSGASSFAGSFAFTAESMGSAGPGAFASETFSAQSFRSTALKACVLGRTGNVMLAQSGLEAWMVQFEDDF